MTTNAHGEGEIVNRSTQRNPDRDHAISVPRHDDRITLDEIQDVMADTGYSADQRKGWLKQVLTDLAMRESEEPSPDRAQMIETVKQIIDDNVEGTPVIKDVL